MARAAASILKRRLFPVVLPRFTSTRSSTHYSSVLPKKEYNDVLVKRKDGGIYYYSRLSTHIELGLIARDEIEPPKFVRTPHVVAAGSCNGLVCLDDLRSNVILWNPATHRFKTLPHSSVRRPSIEEFEIFFPQCSMLRPATVSSHAHCSGFGFDCKSNDYKVIRLISNSFEDEEGGYIASHDQVELYSLKTNSWKELPVPDDVGAFNPKSAYVNGAYYWLALGDTGESLILSFDFVDEKFSTLPSPKINRSESVRLLELDDLLCLVVHPIAGIDKSFQIWVWEDGSWTEGFVFRTSGVGSLLGFWRNGRELFLQSVDKELLLFDPDTGTVKNLGIYEHPRMMQLVPFVQTSVPLDGKSDIA